MSTRGLTPRDEVEAIVAALGHETLSQFQDALRDRGFKMVFGSTASGIPNCDLMLARLWSPMVEDEKVSGYVLSHSGARRLSKKQLDMRALAVFEIVGRHNTLSERLALAVKYHQLSETETTVSMYHDPSLPVSFVYKKQNHDHVLRYSTELRDLLQDGGKLPMIFDKAVNRFASQGGEIGRYPDLARAIRRKLRHTGGDALLAARKHALQRIAADSASLNSLSRAVFLLSQLTDPLDRSPGAAYSALVRHFDQYIDFLSIIQASLLFAPWHHHSVALLTQRNGLGLVLACVSSRRMGHSALRQAQPIAAAFLETALNEQQRLKAKRDETSQTEILDALLAKEPSAKLDTYIPLGDEPHRSSRFEKLKALVSGLRDLSIDVPAALGVAVLASSLGEVSDYRHEGSPCRYLLLYGPGSSWRLFAETISREEGHGIPLSMLLRSNYSIFQDSRVAGFVDMHVLPEAKGLSYLGRLAHEPDDAWLRTHATEQLFAISSRGDGLVRIYGKGSLLGTWQHRTNEFRSDKRQALKKALSTVKDSTWAHEVHDALTQIEETPGEGALVILGNEKRIKPHISAMEWPNLQMNWAKVGSLEYTDPWLLRALLRRDGASVIFPDGKLVLRQLIFPVDVKRRRAIALDFGDETELGKKLLGRGSRHYTAECLSRALKQDGIILALSVDGGVKVWPPATLPA